MTNPNIRKSIERISDELDRLVEHVRDYSGVPSKDITFVRNVSVDILHRAEEMIELCDEARRR